MHFSSSIAFDFKLPSLSAFTHAHNREGQVAKIRQTRCLIMPVEANLNPEVFSILTHHPFEKNKKNLRSRLLWIYVVVDYFVTFNQFIFHWKYFI